MENALTLEGEETAALAKLPLSQIHMVMEPTSWSEHALQRAFISRRPSSQEAAHHTNAPLGNGRRKHPHHGRHPFRPWGLIC